MPDKDNEQIKVGIRVNPNREGPTHPAFFFWMRKLESEDFVEKNSGALWMRVGNECPEDKKPEAKEFMQNLSRAIAKKWISINGNLEVQAIYEALEKEGPPPLDEEAPPDDDECPF